VRVAFVGKGGSGKSVIAGTFARLLSRTGAPVLALDSDPLPGLAFSLGAEVTDAPIPDDAVEEKPEGEEGMPYRLRAGLSADDAVERYAARAPDDVRFLQFGKLRGHAAALMRSQVAYREIVHGLSEHRWSLVGDLPGGTRQPFFGWAGFADIVVVVVEPTAKSILSARRLSRLADDPEGPSRVVAVVNKARDGGDAATVGARSRLEVIASVPWDEAVAEAERAGRAPIDAAPESAGVRAVASIVTYLHEERTR